MLSSALRHFLGSSLTLLPFHGLMSLLSILISDFIRGSCCKIFQMGIQPWKRKQWYSYLLSYVRWWFHNISAGNIIKNIYKYRSCYTILRWYRVPRGKPLHCVFLIPLILLLYLTIMLSQYFCRKKKKNPINQGPNTVSPSKELCVASK